MRVLVVDDHQPTLEAIQVYLAEFKKVYVEVAQGVSDALPILRLEPEILLLDYWLQHETCERIMLAARMRYNPYICVMTAAKDIQFKNNIKPNTIIYKPFSLDALDKILLM